MRVARSMGWDGRVDDEASRSPLLGAGNERETDGEGGPCAGRGFAGKGSAMALDDPGTDAESESGAVGLGGEERVEQAALHVGRYARSQVADREAHDLGGLPIDTDLAQFGGERDGGSGGAGIGGVADEVQEDLTKLLGVGGERGFVDGSELDLESLAFEVGAQETGKFAEGGTGLDEGGAGRGGL